MTRSDARAHRLGDLLGFTVRTASGRALGHVNDVRLAPTSVVHGVFPELVTDGLVVAGRHAASMLGYDRRAEQGPWLVRKAVRWLHRDGGYLPWSAVEHIDWSASEVVVSTDRLEALEAP